MFLEHFHLREQPFGVTPDPRFLCLGPSHREAMASLLYGIHSGRGFMALIAEPGMGKTTLLFELLRSLGNSAKTVFVFQTQCSPDDFLRSILSDLGIAHRGANLVEMQSRLNQVMLKEAAAGRRVVVAIDEAQNLEEPVLELLRMLSNFETPREKLMQIILTGQPQLATKLSSPTLVQLRQRISIFGRLHPLTAPEINSYIDHRLRVAGYQSHTSLFTDSAKSMIARYSRGIPRDINNICFNALSLACALKHKSIDTPVIQEVLHDLDLRPLQTQAASALIAPRERLEGRGSLRLERAKIQVVQHFLDDGGVDGLVFESAGQRQSVEANIVDVSRYPPAVARDHGPGAVRKQRGMRLISRDPQAMIDIIIYFLCTQILQSPEDRNSSGGAEPDLEMTVLSPVAAARSK